MKSICIALMLRCLGDGKYHGIIFLPPDFTLSDFITRQMAWVWLLWLLSQTWITIHIWTPKAERLASTEKLFVIPMYNGLLIDQSMALNRKRDDQKDVKTEVRIFLHYTDTHAPYAIGLFIVLAFSSYLCLKYLLCELI